MVKNNHSIINIKEADFNDIEPCASIALLGKRRTGKTTWAKYLLQYINKSIDRFVVICGNKDNGSEWKQIIHPLYVMNKDENHLKRIRDYQDVTLSKIDKTNVIPRKYRICIILDDCGSDRSFMHSNIMKDILSNGRHYGMTIIMLCQYLNQMHCENRDQIDYLLVLHTSNNRNVRKIHDEYGSTTDLRSFKYILNACTVNRGCCWIDNTKNAINVSDSTYYKRIKWPCTFSEVGSSHVRTYGDQHHLIERKLVKLNKTELIEHSNYYADSDEIVSEDSDTLDIATEFIINNNETYEDKQGKITIMKTLKRKID